MRSGCLIKLTLQMAAGCSACSLSMLGRESTMVLVTDIPLAIS